MARYINAGEFRNIITQNFLDCVAENDESAALFWEDCMGILDEQPTADVKEVVYCKDCVIGEPSCLGDGWIYCRNNLFHHKSDHFCSYGEKKEVE